MRFVSREGFTRDIDTLIRFVATPRLETTERSDYVTLARPASRILIVMDPHGALHAEEGRRAHKDKWVRLIREAIRREFGTDVPRSVLEHLVSVMTWPNGESFEFAHFTDRELAQAICAIRNHTLNVEELQAIVAEIRGRRGNLKEVLPRRIGKRDLADRLWPRLRRRVLRAQSRKTHARIPVVEVLEQARTIILEFPTGTTALALSDENVEE